MAVAEDEEEGEGSTVERSSGGGGSEESEGAPQAENSDLPIAGHHRLSEDREQHDEAEKNSEANRLRR